MKKLLLFPLLFSAAVLVSSCGPSRQTVQNSQQMYPARTLRTTEPCIELANAESEFLRAYGTATSYVEKTALNEAERDARNRLATMLKVAVEGAAQDYEMNANQNNSKSASTIGEAVMTQFVSEELQNTRILKTNIYDLADGSIQVYVCIEMKSDENEMAQKLDNVLSQDNIIGIKYDREKFIEKMKSGLEEYKQKNMQE